jgi:GATA-binding protein
VLTTSGLYYKLHGVHRPVAMKKAIIKRRKRVVPASQGAQGPGVDATGNPLGSPESDRHSPTADSQEHRGTVNPDGSVNLGFRPRNQERRAVLPEPNRAQNGQQQPSNLTAYASTTNNQGQAHQSLESLNNENRLPPMTSYPSPTQRRPSLSPNSFLSPSRKRSFSVTELEGRSEAGSLSDPIPPVQSKRLSSIKSILNPGFTDPEAGDVEPPLRHALSPGPGRHPAVGSPMSSAYTPSPASSVVGSALNSGRDAQSESERAKQERREMLQREADRMREALKAKERELAELAESE